MGLHWVADEVIEDACEYSLSFWGFEILHEDLLVFEDMLEDFTSYCSRMLHDLEVENIGDRSEGNENSFQYVGVSFLQDLNGGFID